MKVVQVKMLTELTRNPDTKYETSINVFTVTTSLASLINIEGGSAVTYRAS